MDKFSCDASKLVARGAIFYTLKEAQVVIEQWRNHYNTKRPYSAFGHRRLKSFYRTLGNEEGKQTQWPLRLIQHLDQLTRTGQFA